MVVVGCVESSGAAKRRDRNDAGYLGVFRGLSSVLLVFWNRNLVGPLKMVLRAGSWA